VRLRLALLRGDGARIPVGTHPGAQHSRVRGRHDHRVDRRDPVELGERVLVELRRRRGVERRHRLRLARSPSSVLDDLEEDDRDVVLAAAAIGRGDELLRGGVEVVAARFDDVEDLLVADHRSQPVGADQEEVAGVGLDRERVDVDVRVGSERARDHRALRVRLRLLGRQPARPDELCDERVVLRQLVDLTVANQVRARVADVTDRDDAVLEQRDRDRRPHARRVRVLACTLVHLAVRLLDQRDDARLAASVDRLAEGGRGDA
jgi:hypothetical protein